MKASFHEYLRHSVLESRAIEDFLTSRRSILDPELGYVAANGPPFADAMDGSLSISTVQGNGARTSFVYADRKSRVNTYGNSYTHCDQVNDAETWQEYLAGHLGEPIRNFGTGGHGVYQAYRRMLREERTDHAAEYLILYVWGDDSTRSLFRSIVWISAAEGSHPANGIFPLFPGSFKANVELDLSSGRFVEKENLLPTADVQYRLSDPNWLVENLKDDLALQLALYELGVIDDLDVERIVQLARWLDFPLKWRDVANRRRQAEALLDRYAQRSTLFVLGKAQAFARERGKKLLVVLNSPERALPQMLRNEARFDREVVELLRKEPFDYFDMNEVHVQDFRNYRLNYQDYIMQYHVPSPVSALRIGHYSPRGNHFFAYAIKDRIVGWLDPRPMPYQLDGSKRAEYEHQTMDTGPFRIRVYSRPDHELESGSTIGKQGNKPV